MNSDQYLEVIEDIAKMTSDNVAAWDRAEAQVDFIYQMYLACLMANSAPTSEVE